MMDVEGIVWEQKGGEVIFSSQRGAKLGENGQEAPQPRNNIVRIAWKKISDAKSLKIPKFLSFRSFIIAKSNQIMISLNIIVTYTYEIITLAFSTPSFP